MNLNLGISLKYPRRLNYIGEPLLQLVPGASAAYSLRSLTRDFIPLVKVRRDSDNAEREFSSNEIKLGDMEDWVGAGNNGFIKTWYEQSSNNNNSTQTDSTKQPKIVSAGVYLGEVDFNGTQYFETIPSGEVLSDIANTFTVWLGKRKGSGFVSQASSYFGNQSSLELRYWVCTIGQEAKPLKVGAITDVNTLISLTGSNGVYDGFKNGSNVNDTQTTSSTGAGDFTLGATRLGYQPLVGTIKEFIIYDSDQTNNRTTVEGNITNHYNI